MIRTRRRARRPLVLGLAMLAGVLAAGPVAAAPASAAAKESSRAVLSGIVNINTASVEELQLLPGVGKARADAILAMRKERGGFKSVDELTQVKGIGDSMLERLRPHVALRGETTARSEPASSKERAAAK